MVLIFADFFKLLKIFAIFLRIPIIDFHLLQYSFTIKKPTFHKQQKKSDSADHFLLYGAP